MEKSKSMINLKSREFIVIISSESGTVASCELFLLYFKLFIDLIRFRRFINIQDKISEYL